MSRTRARTCARRPAAGIVLLALLLAMALGGIALMAAVDVWSLARQREREQELLFAGDQYRKAIERYYFGAPTGTARVLPARVEDLLVDNRYPVPVHHLRRIYPDPMTGSTEWGLLQLGDRIAGVHSLSDRKPVKQAGFAPDHEQFSGKTAYREWIFVALPGISPTSSGAPSPGKPASGATPFAPERTDRWTLP